MFERCGYAGTSPGLRVRQADGVTPVARRNARLKGLPEVLGNVWSLITVQTAASI